VAARPPLIPPADPRRLARQLRVTGRIVFIISLFVAGRMAWTEWRRPEPAPEELIPGYDAAERRQVGEMYGLFARDLWDAWSDVRRPYPAAAIIATSRVLVLWGFNRLARGTKPRSSRSELRRHSRPFWRDDRFFRNSCRNCEGGWVFGTISATGLERFRLQRSAR